MRGEQELVRRAARSSRCATRARFGSKVGFEYIATTPPVFTSSTTTDPRRPASAGRGGLLGLGRQREHDGAGHGLAGDELAEVRRGHAEVAARELRRVLGLDADRTELDRLVADDLREQLGGGGG